MRVDIVIRDNRETIGNLVRALDNRLTASENLAPEGEVGEVLTSTGPNTPPEYTSLRSQVIDILTELGLYP